MIDTLREWIDNIFSPFHAFLDLVIEQLSNAGVVTAQGINLGNYFYIFGDLPGPWQTVISSLMISIALIGFLFIIRAIMRLYYAKKEGVKWW